ncbi:hypothetical protein WJ86_00510 [Burkholderia multivorans]|nr:hypothetical protein WJ86_00510 [Burkholderia multivorans]
MSRTTLTQLQHDVIQSLIVHSSPESTLHLRQIVDFVVVDISFQKWGAERDEKMQTKRMRNTSTFENLAQTVYKYHCRRIF